MLAQGAGSIVNLTSNTHMGSRPGIYADQGRGRLAGLHLGDGARRQRHQVNALSPFGATRMVLASFDDAEAQRPRRLSAAGRFAGGRIPPVRCRRRSERADGADPWAGGLSLCPSRADGAARGAIEWTAEALADAFAKEFKSQLVPCGDAHGASLRSICRAVGRESRFYVIAM